MTSSKVLDVATTRKRRVKAKQDHERARILAVSTNLFFELGYSGTTVEAIADKLGVKKPFIYWYFDNKEDIFAALCLRSAQASKSTLVLSSDEPDALRALYESCRRIALVSVFDYQASALPFRAPGALGAEAAIKMKKYGREYSRGLANLLRRAKSSKEVDCADFKVTALMIGGIVTSLHRWYRPNGRLGPQQLAHKLASAMVAAAGGPNCDRLQPKRLKTSSLSLQDEPWATAYWWLTANPLTRLS
jgi:AcrR family transcriptional regulator